MGSLSPLRFFRNYCEVVCEKTVKMIRFFHSLVGNKLLKWWGVVVKDDADAPMDDDQSGIYVHWLTVGWRKEDAH